MKPTVQPKQKVKNYEIYPKSGEGRTIMYQNMSSHYKRIYNVKPRVDSGISPSHKRNANSLRKPFTWNNSQSAPISSMKSLRLSLSSTDCSENARPATRFPKGRPQVLKLEKESKLRTRGCRPSWGCNCTIVEALSQSSTQQGFTISPELSVAEVPWTRSEDSDSILCKGSSSGSAKSTEGASWSGSEGGGPDAREERASSDDLEYVKFVRGITEEVLKKGDFTNKGLARVFQKHIDANKRCLSLRRMKEEVGKLQVELGMREESRSQLNLCLDYSISGEDEGVHSPSDGELWEALSLLNISPSFKADIASSLGLQSAPSPRSSSSSLSSKGVQKSSTTSSFRESNGRARFSKSLQVIFDARERLEMLPDSDAASYDDDSYEKMIESSRPFTPLRLVW